MQQTLITQQDYGGPYQAQEHEQNLTTFRSCLQVSQRKGLYQRKLFFLMAAYWLVASFFIALPFFLFKKPIYCEVMTQGLTHCCEEGDDECISQICSKYQNSIIDHIKPETSLTYIFRLFCGNEWVRIMYKVFPETLCLFGFLLYGTLSDLKGRKVTIKISWRMFTMGVIIFSTAQAQFLKSFGYVLASIHCLPSLMNQFVLFFEYNTKKQKNRQSLFLLAFLFVGPLVLSLIEEFIYGIDNRILLGALCAAPAFILSLLTDKIHQSAVCVYPYNKQKAFGIVNFLARQNKQEPIMIDLSRSFWLKTLIPNTSLLALLRRKPVNIKMVLGLFFTFIASFNIKISQVSLDDYTSTTFRSVLVNVTTALADLTLCIALIRIQNRACRPMNIGIILLIISLLACQQMDFTDQTIKLISIIHAVAIRYLSQLCRGLLLIWSIETFPTICRGYCVGFVFCGTAIGCLVAYLMIDLLQYAYIISLVSTTLMVVLEGYIDLQKSGVMKDTLHDTYYDENDRFYKG